MTSTEQTVQLGSRLLQVASYVPEQAYLGDIGTDHAYLPIHLWEQRKIQHAVGVDVHEGPYRSACAAIEARQLEPVIDIRLGDGIKPLLPGEVDCLTLAGMGGNTMLEIFAGNPEVFAQITTLVLQPQGAEGKVRLSLLQSGWKLVKETLVEEDDRIYVVMLFSRSSGQSYSEIQEKIQQLTTAILHRLDPGLLGGGPTAEKIIWDLGPLLIANPAPELRKIVEERIHMLGRALSEMGKSQQAEVQEKIQHRKLERKIGEELLKWLFP